MRKLTRYFIALLSGTFLLTVSARASNDIIPRPRFHHDRLSSFNPSARFDSMWVDYDITQDNQRGMLMHLKFTVFQMKDVDADVAVFFEYNDDRGGRIRDKNKHFYSEGGDVAVYKHIKPGYYETDYKNLQIFMPYDELDLKSGKYDLTMAVSILFSDDGMLMQDLTRHNFQFTKP